MLSRLVFMLACFLLEGCHAPLPSTAWSMHQINGREEGVPPIRFPVYQAKVPSSWIRKELPPSTSLQNSRWPICEFFIREDGAEIRITVHNFPEETMQGQGDPHAQVARWKKQFEQLNPLQQHIQVQSGGGFGGLYFEGSGLMKGQQVKMLGWSMQLAKEHLLNIQSQGLLLSDPYFRQAVANYTIKVVGPSLLVEQHQAEIEAFVASFELIRELPEPL